MAITVHEEVGRTGGRVSLSLSPVQRDGCGVHVLPDLATLLVEMSFTDLVCYKQGRTRQYNVRGFANIDTEVISLVTSLVQRGALPGRCPQVLPDMAQEASEARQRLFEAGMLTRALEGEGDTSYSLTELAMSNLICASTVDPQGPACTARPGIKNEEATTFELIV